MPDTGAKTIVKPPSVRRLVNRRIFRFSVSIGTVAALLLAVVFLARAYPSVHQLKQTNLSVLKEIKNCNGKICDTSAFLADLESTGSDYIIDRRSRYFISFPHPTAEEPGRFPPLDYSDTRFIEGFRKPGPYTTEDGEIWRLYSREATVLGNNVEIVVGYAEKASWKSETLCSSIGDVDGALKRDADKIADTLPRAPIRLSADGFAVVDARTEQFVNSGLWLPEHLPKAVPLPTPGWRPYTYHGDLYVLETDANEDILAASFFEVGDLRWLAALCGSAFFGTSIITYAVSRRFWRGYFALTGIRVPSIEEALRSGEGQGVEFKRGLSDDGTRTGGVEEELLKSIAAFANTNDGVVILGIDDEGHIRGLRLDFTSKDRLERKIFQLVRHRIKPTPPIQITFEDVRGLMIAKIAVARGEAPIYMMNGVIYFRHGSSDVQAGPEDLRRLVPEWAF